MFDAVRNNKRIVQIFLALITLPFAFFGVESYMSNGGAGGEVATIGDLKITQPMFQQTLREEQERLSREMREQFDPKMLDTPEVRRAILDNLIDRQLLMMEASRMRLQVDDGAVRDGVLAIDAFKVDGKFSAEQYRKVLAPQGFSPESFEAQLRQDLTMQRLIGGVGQSHIVARTLVDRVAALRSETREVMEFRYPLENYLVQAKLADNAAQQFYDENVAQFMTPEAARAEYLVLSLDALAADLKVPEAEIKARYEANQSRYGVPEERRASHILIASEKLGKDKARARAEELLAEVRKSPAGFEALAKKNSDDPGSAAKGGDLGFFGRGMMVKPFEEAAFALQQGEISGVVESDFGMHIIKLTGVRPARIKPLADVRTEIEGELKTAAASRKFAEAAETFSNLVYEQPDSLQPVADQLKLVVRTTDWITRQPNPAAGPLGNDKVLAALFGDDAVKQKRNTEAVQINANTLVSARVVEYRPAARKPFESVKASIEQLLRRKEALALARQAGEAQLAMLQKGEDNLKWGATKAVSRADSRQLPQAAAQAIFKLTADKLPAYTGVEVPGGGYALVKLTRVTPGPTLDDTGRRRLTGILGQVGIEQESKAYLAALRSRYKVDVNTPALEAK